jgi:predicted MFS family arabinose efflux permease
VFSTQLLLQLAPDDVRGRVFSTEFALFTLTNAAGAAAAGLILDSPQVDLSLLLWWMSALTLVPGALWVGWILFGQRDHPAPAGTAPEEQPLPSGSRVSQR